MHGRMSVSGCSLRRNCCCKPKRKPKRKAGLVRFRLPLRSPHLAAMVVAACVFGLLLATRAVCWSPRPALVSGHRGRTRSTVDPARGGKTDPWPLAAAGAARKRTRTTRTRATRLYGVLSRSAILRHSKQRGSGNQARAPAKQSRPRGKTATATEKITRNFLLDATEEALFRQQRAMDSLESERAKLVGSSDGSRPAEGKTPGVDARQSELFRQRKDMETLRTELQRLPAKASPETAEQLAAIESRFRNIVSPPRRGHRTTTTTTTSKPKPSACPILDRPRDTWKIQTSASARASRQFGRPRGFSGLVCYSPLGVPILVSDRSFSADGDAFLRRIAQGADLWFQVEDYDGSLVLLRTSLVRGAKNSGKCLQAAADLAAAHSVWGRKGGSSGFPVPDTVPVVYTDSRHVAKRGSKAGRMRKRKSFGRLMGRPSEAVEDGDWGMQRSQ